MRNIARQTGRREVSGTREVSAAREAPAAGEVSGKGNGRTCAGAAGFSGTFGTWEL